MPGVVVFNMRLIGESYGSVGMTMRWIDDSTGTLPKVKGACDE